jgi:hypothetical protein
MTFEQGTALAPASDDRIRWFEETYRVKLPTDYIYILKNGNGAVPTNKIFVQGRRERVIERMLCLLSNPQDDQTYGWYDLGVVISQIDSRLIDDENLVGTNVVPIAVLFGGDYVCLDYRCDPNAPVVAVWDHERSDEFQPLLEVVAQSFSAFDAMLSS